MSAEPPSASRSAPAGQRTASRTSAPREKMPPSPREPGTSTTSSCASPARPRSWIRADSTASRLPSFPRSGSRSTVVSAESDVRTSISPAGTERSRRSGPGVSKRSCLIAGLRDGHRATTACGAAAARRSEARRDRRGAGRRSSFLLSGAGVALQAVPRRAAAGSPAGDGAGEGADEPRVHRDAVLGRRRLDGGLQRLGQPQRDANAERVLGRGCGLLRRVLDVDKGRILTGEPHLDVSLGELAGELEGRFGEDVEEAKAGGGLQRAGEAMSRGRDGVVAHGCDLLEVALERVDEGCHLHDVIMTSSWRRQTSRWRRPQLRSVGVAVDPLELLDPVDVGARLGEGDSLALAAPGVDVSLARVVRRERRPLVAVLVEEMAQVPRAVADVDLRLVEVVDAEARAA